MISSCSKSSDWEVSYTDSLVAERSYSKVDSKILELPALYLVANEWQSSGATNDLEVILCAGLTLT